MASVPDIDRGPFEAQQNAAVKTAKANFD